jgi:hypothetical protein
MRFVLCLVRGRRRNPRTLTQALQQCRLSPTHQYTHWLARQVRSRQYRPLRHRRFSTTSLSTVRCRTRLTLPAPPGEQQPWCHRHAWRSQPSPLYRAYARPRRRNLLTLQLQVRRQLRPGPWKCSWTRSASVAKRSVEKPCPFFDALFLDTHAHTHTHTHTHTHAHTCTCAVLSSHPSPDRRASLSYPPRPFTLALHVARAAAQAVCRAAACRGSGTRGPQCNLRHGLFLCVCVCVYVCVCVLNYCLDL